MQFHLNGFRLGDPLVAEAAQGAARIEQASLPARTDVLIVGCGPAGLTLAAQLAAFPGIATLVVDQKSGPLQLGQADGVACRTMEMFEAFGFAERVLKEAYWVNETTFWKPEDGDPSRIARSGRVQDTEDGLSEFPHVILNQARVHDFYLDVMRNSPTRLEPHYDRKLIDVTIDPALRGQAGAYPVTARFERLDAGHEGEIETVEARYAVGCDGARSTVRKSLGLELKGDSANHAWGVMDVLAVTDFPDIRFKSLIQSASEGSIVIIPREGGYLVRFYIELDKLSAGERVASRNITVDHLIAAARRILNPYELDVREVAWWSVYDIGQRLCDRFDDVSPDETGTQLPRVFIAGDACHTHSPKAGQGMNVSMQDAFNLGWKLAAVLRGQAAPQLLRTYSTERQSIAAELIGFDREWAKMLSMPARRPGDPDGVGVDPAETQRYFVQHGRYTAGTATVYSPSAITGGTNHQHLARGLPIGMRFHSAPVVRLADAKPMQLGHVARADGRWRIFAFAGAEALAGVGALCAFLESAETSPLRRFTPASADVDAVIDLCAVFQQPHTGFAPGDLPSLLLPAKGTLGLRDYEKAFCADLKGGDDIFDMRGIDREAGCIVVVRPDQYVAHVLPLGAHAELAAFFDAFMTPAA
ncbi:FAD-binding monooxygenase [Mesorhizobium sp. CAU 1741]|uniref:FAD-binding monooxygenase n=1 Tax=Mesorhizobium sp. CAU 1741 TaxID=3140366 RepID=UPI00325C1FDF